MFLARELISVAPITRSKHVHNVNETVFSLQIHSTTTASVQNGTNFTVFEIHFFSKVLKLRERDTSYFVVSHPLTTQIFMPLGTHNIFTSLATSLGLTRLLTHERTCSHCLLDQLLILESHQSCCVAQFGLVWHKVLETTQEHLVTIFIIYFFVLNYVCRKRQMLLKLQF